MKVIILSGIKEWIIKKNRSGPVVWQEIAQELGFGAQQFNNQDNYASNERIERFFQAICDKMFIERKNFENQFIQFWMTDFAPRLYQSLTSKATDSKDFLMQVTRMNNEVVALFPDNKNISRIDVSEKNDYTLVAVYASEKSLIDIIGILRVVSGIFQNTFNIKKINPHSAEIIFDNNK